MKIRLDLSEWTMGDVADLEHAAEMSWSRIAAAMSSGDMPYTLVIALAYIARRREDSAFTLADARSLKVSEFEIEVVPEAPLASSKSAPSAG